MSELPPLMPFQKDILELIRKGKVSIQSGYPPRRMGKSYLNRIAKACSAKGKKQTPSCKVLVVDGGGKKQ